MCVLCIGVCSTHRELTCDAQGAIPPTRSTHRNLPSAGSPVFNVESPNPQCVHVCGRCVSVPVHVFVCGLVG